jgi:hypothetical protein
MVPKGKPLMTSLSRRSFFTGMIATAFARLLPRIAAVVARATSWEIVAKTWGLRVV